MLLKVPDNPHCKYCHSLESCVHVGAPLVAVAERTAVRGQHGQVHSLTGLCIGTSGLAVSVRMCRDMPDVLCRNTFPTGGTLQRLNNDGYDMRNGAYHKAHATPVSTEVHASQTPMHQATNLSTARLSKSHPPGNKLKFSFFLMARPFPLKQC